MNRGSGRKTVGRVRKTGGVPTSSNIIIHVKNLRCDVSVNQDVYGKDDLRKIRYLVEGFSKNIWIDRTYVSYDGNRFKDAFIRESGWNTLVDMVNRTILGRSRRKKMTRRESETNQEIIAAVIVISLEYLYDMVSKYGFDPSEICIDVKGNSRFNAEYSNDTRTSWNF